MEAINYKEIRRNNDPILKNFSHGFIDNVNTVPIYHRVYSMLQDVTVTPYDVIEALLKLNEGKNKTITEYEKAFIKLN